jgi:hypothetical protein
MGVIFSIWPHFVGHAVLPSDWCELVRQLVKSLSTFLGHAWIA